MGGPPPPCARPASCDAPRSPVVAAQVDQLERPPRPTHVVGGGDGGVAPPRCVQVLPHEEQQLALPLQERRLAVVPAACGVMGK